MNDKALPAWDLSDLYDGIEDEKIAADLEKYRAFCVDFAGRYKGRLGELDGAGMPRASNQPLSRRKVRSASIR